MNKSKISIDKIHLGITYLVRIIIIGAIAGAVFERQWITIFVSFLALVLTFLPSLIEKNYKIHIPVEAEIGIIIFIYASIFLGEVRGYYTRFWWWDLVLHAGSGIALGFVGFTIMYLLQKGEKLKTNPFLIALFSFCFALAIGALWEVFEFTVDLIFKTNMQKSSFDTMGDLIVDSIGAIIASSLGYLYLKKERMQFINIIIEKFKKENPKFLE